MIRRNSKTPFFIKLLSAALSAALIVAAPGPFAARAFANVLAGAKAAAGRGAAVPGVPMLGHQPVQINTSIPLAAPSLNTSLTPLGTLPSLSLSLPASTVLPNAAKFNAVQSAAAIPAANTAAGNAAAKITGPARAAKTSLGVLRGGAEKLEKSAAPSARFATLRSLFSGRRTFSKGAVFASADVADEDSPFESGLSPLGIEELEAVAIDTGKELKERQNAVEAIGKLGGEEAPAALKRVSEANPEGGAADYEVHRKALQVLAVDFQQLFSLRPMTRAHADEKLAEIEKNKPEMAFFDYDETLTPSWKEKALSPEMAEGIEQAAKAGVEMVILTDRPDEKKGKSETIVESIAPATPSQKRSFSLISSRGTRWLAYGRKGWALFNQHPINWSDAERDAILEVRKLVVERFGEQVYNDKTHDLSAYGFAQFLPIGMPAETVKEAAAFMEAELAKRGVEFPVVGRTARNPKEDPPYLMLSKIDKSLAVAPARANRRALQQIGDFLRFGLPGRLAKAAWKGLNLFPQRRVQPGKTLVVGDQFFDTRVADLGFVKGAPGALAISVGETADPRLENIFVWPKNNSAGTAEILGALAKKTPSGMNKKAVVGLFAQRSASIAVFILVSIAYPFVVTQVAGLSWATYGALMAFGPLASIATGPLTGLIVDRLSARNALALNAGVRVALNLVLPIFAFFGVLNFWTLLIASVANGWNLASVVVTENAYIPRLSGKFTGEVFNLGWINFYGLQVLLGGVFAVGALVDTWSPMTAFLLAGAINAFVVLPIIAFTMPNIAPTPKTLLAMQAKLDKIAAKKEKAKGDKLKELIAREEALSKAMVARREQLGKAISENGRIIDAALAEIRDLEFNKPEGFKKRVRFLKVDNALRLKEATRARRELAMTPTGWRSWVKAVGKFAKTYWLEAAIFVAASASYGFTGNTIPIIAALLFWIGRTDMFKALWYGQGSDATPDQLKIQEQVAANKKAIEDGAENAAALKAENRKLKKQNNKWQYRLRYGLLFWALTALMMYPLQYFGFPNIAMAIGGVAGKGALFGMFLASLFLGNLITNAAKLNLPELRLPLLGSLPGQRIVQVGVMGLVGAWVYAALVPGSIFAAAAAALGAAVLMWLANKLTLTGWVKFMGIGFTAAIALAYAAWSTALLPWLSLPEAVMIAAAMIGLFYGPSNLGLLRYFFGNANEEKLGRMGGVQSSFYSGAVSLGYGLLAMGAAMLNPAFPSLLVPMGIVFALGGLLLWQAPRYLPGMPKELFQKDAKKK